MAEPYGAAVEGEVGQVGGWESGGVSADAQYAEPGEAVRYVDETGVQALAVGIGNIHGAYGQQPALRFDVLQTIRQRIAVPLVLHGGSGLTEDDFHRAITLGMCKINVGTALFDAAAGARPRNGGSIFSMSLDMADRVRVVALGHIERFGSQGKAGFAR